MTQMCHLNAHWNIIEISPAYTQYLSISLFYAVWLCLVTCILFCFIFVKVIWLMIHMDGIFGNLICSLFLKLLVYPVPIYHLFVLWCVMVFALLYCIAYSDFKFCPLPLNWGGFTSRVSQTHQKGGEGWVWPEWPHPLSLYRCVPRGPAGSWLDDAGRIVSWPRWLQEFC